MTSILEKLYQHFWADSAAPAIMSFSENLTLSRLLEATLPGPPPSLRLLLGLSWVSPLLPDLLM